LIAPEFRPSTLESSVKILNSNSVNLLNRLANFVGGPEIDVHPFMNLHAVDNVCGELRHCYHTIGRLSLLTTQTHLTTDFFFAETFMGAKINAQQNSESEYVKAINM
jgi:hypothetical protein